MGLFDVFRKADFKASAELIKNQAIGIDLAAHERDLLHDLSIQVGHYVKERNLMRVGLSKSGVAFFWSKSPPIKTTSGPFVLLERLV